MIRTTDPELQRKLQELAQQLPPADWVREMVAHYQRTGTFRPQDLRRLLGDPNRAVEVGNHPSVSAHFSSAADSTR